MNQPIQWNITRVLRIAQLFFQKGDIFEAFDARGISSLMYVPGQQKIESFQKVFSPFVETKNPQES